MRAICVDDDEMVLDLTISFMEESDFFSEVRGFISAKEAIEYMKNSKVSLALLDVDMPEMDGMTLAGKLREIDPKLSIIFLTGYSQYAVDAFKVHAEGYLLKPIEKDKLFEELSYVLDNRDEETKTLATARTFGNFDLFVGGQSVVFKRSKSKELLAYLIDQRGGTVTRAEAFSALWEDGLYDRSMQKQMDVIIRSLKDTLKEYDISDILEIKSGSMRINTELIECDMYDYLDGDENAIKSYRGVYMNSYYWASMTEGMLLDDRIDY
ncbi:response regulator [Butyrivibrio proteoclasticus]|uniref:response regulator n=1 Tax=Butyrivibrio proteoclasticus TaxID=43305 RepID=UPI00047E29E3|nr:response regulator [Butyrivibrio proteoclasticus]